MKKIATTALLLICTAAFAQQKGTFTDSRDGKTYKTVKISTQTWMAENLNYNANGSKCYDNNSANCEKYGRLYNWETAKKACPSGWHLQSEGELALLSEDVGGSGIAGRKLKAKSGWSDNGNGTDEFEFSALPGGAGGLDGSFGNVNSKGTWWSASEYGSNIAYCWGMNYYSEGAGGENGCDKSYLLSVRCVQDETGRTREEIMGAVIVRTPGLKHIYNEYLKLRPGFSGKVILKFTIAPGGDIISISIVSSTTGYAEFDNAIKDKVATWKWKTVKSGNTTPTIPFNFTE